ncbi:MAG: PilZ domain-containing protein [Desulforhopalus sp.]|nr:PilZ domain-containing protein [Desulforhopalus sp.]
MLQLENRRKSFRMPFVTNISCYIKEIDAEFQGMLRDISITGLYGEVDGPPLTAGWTCNLSITFTGDHSRLVVEGVCGKIVRSETQGVAIEFDKRLEWFILVPLFFQKISGKACSIPQEFHSHKMPVVTQEKGQQSDSLAKPHSITSLP